MTQFGMQAEMDTLTVGSIKKALFEGGSYEIKASDTYNDIGLDWGDATSLSQRRHYEPNEGLFWDGSQSAKGILWGGCVESLIFQSTTGKYLPAPEELEGTILCIETAEDIPEPWLVEYLLAGFGERGWFDKFQAVLVGRPKAWEFNKQKSTEEKVAYRAAQRDAVLKTVREYNPTIPIVQNLDFGHTDPQILVPLGRSATIDPSKKTIIFEY